MDPHTDQDIRDLLDRSNGLIPNNYIVIFKYQTPQDKCEAHCTWAHELHCQRVSTSAYGASLTGVNHRYNLPNGWSGYSGSFDETLKKEIEETDEV